jgi:tRNA A37 threonylcarbamoyladenosine dehydratase
VCAPDEPGAAAATVDGSLNCHGYGSSVMVTATFGMVAASQALEALWAVVPTPGAGQKADII